MKAIGMTSKRCVFAVAAGRGVKKLKRRGNRAFGDGGKGRGLATKDHKEPKATDGGVFFSRQDAGGVKEGQDAVRRKRRLHRVVGGHLNLFAIQFGERRQSRTARTRAVPSSTR